MAQEGMCWELVPEDVLETPAELNGADCEREWRRRKHNMEKASRRPWTEFENSPRTVQREDTLREFWEFSVDDKPFPSQRVFRARTCAI